MENRGNPEGPLEHRVPKASPWVPSGAQKIVQIVERARIWTPKGRPLNSKNVKTLQGFSLIFEHELHKFASQIVSMTTCGP